MKRKTIGFINGTIAAASYGTNPLFALPLYARGLNVNSVLFYRYAIAVLIYALWLKFVKKMSFKITKKERETTQGYIDQVKKKRWDSLDNVKITKTREDQINISYDAKKTREHYRMGRMNAYYDTIETVAHRENVLFFQNGKLVHIDTGSLNPKNVSTERVIKTRKEGGTARRKKKK